jgi:hypothetical protein
MQSRAALNFELSMADHRLIYPIPGEFRRGWLTHSAPLAGVDILKKPNPDEVGEHA